MDKIGDIKRGHRADLNHLYMWCVCEVCGKERWVLSPRGIPRFKICQRCAAKVSGEKNHNWRGGKSLDKDKYILIKVSKDNFFFPMAIKSGYIREHRLIMARHLGRLLYPWEIVHHKNGITTDNQLENLELLPSRGEHNTQLNIYILKLEKENAELKEKLKELGG